MSPDEIPVPTPIDVDEEILLNTIDELGTPLRFEELAEEHEGDPDGIRTALVRLVEDGKVSIFSVGDTAQIRRER